MLASLAYGLKRFALLLALTSAGCVVLGLVWALVLGRPVGHAVGVFLFIAAGLLVLISVGGGTTVHLWGEEARSGAQIAHQHAKERGIGDGFWLIPMGVLLTVFGTLVQSHL